jgi:non-homologous end joining protein Ku
MNNDYVVALQKTIDNKIKQLEEMRANNAKAQHCSNLIEEINKYRRLLTKAKQDAKKNQRRT